MSQVLIDTEPHPGLRIKFLGREFGNCNIDPVRADLKSNDPKGWCFEAIGRLQSFVSRHQFKKLVLLKAQFVPAKLLDFKNCQTLKINGTNLYRALEPGDAYRLTPGEAVCIASADCLSAVLWGEGKVLVAHLGLGGLLPIKAQPLLRFLVKTQFKDPTEVSVWLGAAVDDCCYGFGYNHPNTWLVADRIRSYYFKPVSRGPYKLNLGISQIEIARRQLERLGVERIVLDRRCISCWGDPLDDQQGACFSNLRDHDRTFHRNGLVVSYDP